MKGGGGERGRRGGYEVSNLGGSEPARPLVEAKFDLTDGAFDVEMLDTQIAPTHHVHTASEVSQAINWSLWESFLIHYLALTAWSRWRRRHVNLCASAKTITLSTPLTAGLEMQIETPEGVACFGLRESRPRSLR